MCCLETTRYSGACDAVAGSRPSAVLEAFAVSELGQDQGVASCGERVDVAASVKLT